MFLQGGLSPAVNFEKYTTSRVGRFLYERFYRPYAAKLYPTVSPKLGLNSQALTRVRAFRARRFPRSSEAYQERPQLLSISPSRNRGQIAAELNKRFRARGEDNARPFPQTPWVRTGCNASQISWFFKPARRGAGTILPDTVVSTIPIGSLFQLLYPKSRRLRSAGGDL